MPSACLDPHQGILAHVYTNILGSYKAHPHPHFGISDFSFSAFSAYILTVNKVKTVKVGWGLPVMRTE